MLKLLLPKDGAFFEFFREMGRLISETATEFQRLLQAEPESRHIHSQRIKDLEHQADEVTHQTMNKLQVSFITPIDREDIHILIKRLDDIMDFLDASAQRIVLYKIGPVPVEMAKMAEINTVAAEHVRKAVDLLSDMKNAPALLEVAVDINRLENEADTVLRGAVARLFSDEPDLRLLIKLKEIYELLETVSDRCEDVANVIESIVMEYS